MWSNIVYTQMPVSVLVILLDLPDGPQVEVSEAEEHQHEPQQTDVVVPEPPGGDLKTSLDQLLCAVHTEWCSRNIVIQTTAGGTRNTEWCSRNIVIQTTAGGTRNTEWCSRNIVIQTTACRGDKKYRVVQ